MGIYPTTRHLAVNDGRPLAPTDLPSREAWIEEYNAYDGQIRYRLITAEPLTAIRKDCYCCSCPEHGTDPYCRNHGWAGERPCQEHDMPGTPDQEDGVMPASVQAHRLRR